ncbi:unnamed protein product [Moneuplotes crassus]|uniref:Uncharacterized protein n=1 Tax=Euplotes crassus TaxID=5936 RepID=A0AAD1UQX5_EUPCR|nr:unnamed protein product [Moneuplotes crassus]
MKQPFPSFDKENVNFLNQPCKEFPMEGISKAQLSTQGECQSAQHRTFLSNQSRRNDPEVAQAILKDLRYDLKVQETISRLANKSGTGSYSNSFKFNKILKEFNSREDYINCILEVPFNESQSEVKKQSYKYSASYLNPRHIRKESSPKKPKKSRQTSLAKAHKRSMDSSIDNKPQKLRNRRNKSMCNQDLTSVKIEPIRKPLNYNRKPHSLLQERIRAASGEKTQAPNPISAVYINLSSSTKPHQNLDLQKAPNISIRGEQASNFRKRQDSKKYIPLSTVYLTNQLFAGENTSTYYTKTGNTSEKPSLKRTKFNRKSLVNSSHDNIAMTQTAGFKKSFKTKQLQRDIMKKKSRIHTSKSGPEHLIQNASEVRRTRPISRAKYCSQKPSISFDICNS